MAFLVYALAVVIGLASLGCWIYTVVVAFQKDTAVMGILCLCPLVGFIIGWVKVSEWQHTNVMLIWTVCVVVNLALQGIMGFAGL